MSDSERPSRRYLETARNYEKDKNYPKVLEFAIKAYGANSTSPIVISYLGFAYLLQNDKQSYVKGRDVLIANSNRLDETGKAVLGVTESFLENHEKAFQILSSLNLSDIQEYMFPWCVIQLTQSAFETLAYDQAVYKMKIALVDVDRGISASDVKVAAGTTSATATWFPVRYGRFQMTKFHVGRIWLAHSLSKKITSHMLEALSLAGEGLGAGFGLIEKQSLFEHLRRFNVILNDPQLFRSSETPMLDLVDKHVESLARSQKPSYSNEIAKLQVLRNCLIDLHALGSAVEKGPSI